MVPSYNRLCYKSQVNYYIFNVSDSQNYFRERTALETFTELVVQNSIWGFGLKTANRKSVQPGDKAIFYLTGKDNQVFAGAATLSSGAYKDEFGQFDSLFMAPEETLRIDLKDILVFDPPKTRRKFNGLDWVPSQGGSIKISERDYNIILGTIPNPSPEDSLTESDQDFYIEKYLEEFLEKNWQNIDFGEPLDIYEDEDGNSGRQYYAGEAGYIDILAQDKDKNFVVLELKKGRSHDEVVGQVLRYMGWVTEHLAEGKDVRGLIIVGEPDKKLEYAIQMVKDKVSLKLYKVTFNLRDYKSL